VTNPKIKVLIVMSTQLPTIMRGSNAGVISDARLNLAAAAGNSQFANINTQLMQLYRSGKPYHEKAQTRRSP